VLRSYSGQRFEREVICMLSDNQDAFRRKLMDAPMVMSVPGSNLQAEIVRLMSL